MRDTERDTEIEIERGEGERERRERIFLFIAKEKWTPGSENKICIVRGKT